MSTDVQGRAGFRSPKARLDIGSKAVLELSLYPKLKPGPGRSVAAIRENQRARLLGAMVALVGESGYPALTVRRLSRLAGVSTGTFYGHFANIEDCFAQTYDQLMMTALDRAGSVMSTAKGDWQAGLRTGLSCLLSDLARHPAAGRLAFIEIFCAGPAMLGRMQRALGWFEHLAQQALADRPGSSAPPPLMLGAIAAGAARVVRARLLEGRSAELPDLTDPLTEWIVSLGVFRTSSPPCDLRDSPVPHSESRHSLIPTGRIEAVRDDQSRILAAVARLNLDEGYWALTVPKIRGEAGVSRRTFDAHFAGVEDCFLAAVEKAGRSVLAAAKRAAACEDGWDRGVWAASVGLCREVASDPALARLAFVDVLAPGRAGLACRENMLGLAARGMQATAPTDSRSSNLGFEASVSAVWQVLHAEVSRGRIGQIPGLAPTIAFIAGSPLRPS